MNIFVSHIDKNNVLEEKTFAMTRLAFIKHLAIAGQGYAPKPHKLFRTLGMFLHYSLYIRRQAFNSNRFSLPPESLSDPTEQAQFSNLAGKAIADFLTKRIDNSLFTTNYEAAMRLAGHKVKGKRPDLIAYSQENVFAIEAKGRVKNNPGEMTIHKEQARSGPLNVNFSVACVSYNLFDQVKTNYHDPVNEDFPFDNESLRILTRNYYSGFEKFLDLEDFGNSIFEFQDETFYQIELYRRNFQSLIPYGLRFPASPFEELLLEYQPRLLLPINIADYARDGISNEFKAFKMSKPDQENIYIDNDRIGFRIRD